MLVCKETVTYLREMLCECNFVSVTSCFACKSDALLAIESCYGFPTFWRSGKAWLYSGWDSRFKDSKHLLKAFNENKFPCTMK